MSMWNSKGTGFCRILATGNGKIWSHFHIQKLNFIVLTLDSVSAPYSTVYIVRFYPYCKGYAKPSMIILELGALSVLNSDGTGGTYSVLWGMLVLMWYGIVDVSVCFSVIATIPGNPSNVFVCCCAGGFWNFEWKYQSYEGVRVQRSLSKTENLCSYVPSAGPGRRLQNQGCKAKESFQKHPFAINFCFGS